MVNKPTVTHTLIYRMKYERIYITNRLMFAHNLHFSMFCVPTEIGAVTIWSRVHGFLPHIFDTSALWKNIIFDASTNLRA